MRICKQVDPVIDIVIVGFGNKSKLFIDLFLQKNELKGVNIIVISKDNFAFLNKYVQCVELCIDNYIDIYKYCKERNILFINEKVKNVDSFKKTIYFTSDRNHLKYDFLLCDFDYKSSFLLNSDYAHMNIYPFKNKNLFFYYTHIIYLSLIKSQKNKITDIDLYYKWKSIFLENIAVEKFYNFYSYNDKYVDLIFDIYKFVDQSLSNQKSNQIENNIFTLLKKNSLIDDFKKNEETNILEKENFRKNNCFNLILISDNNDLGQELYYEIFQILNKICLSSKIVYVYITDLDIKEINFCENYLIIKKVIEIKKVNNEKIINCMNKNGDIITITYDECINITDLHYPSYFYKSNYKIENNTSINKFCQYENNDSLYFLNQIKNYDDFTICQTIYLNIYNNIHKNKYISIEDVKKKNINIKNCCNLNNSPLTKVFNDLSNYFYNKIMDIIKVSFQYICDNKFIEEKIQLLNNRRKNLECYESDNKIKKYKKFPVYIFINIILYFYNKVLFYFFFLKNKFIGKKEQKNSFEKNKNNTNNSNTYELPKYMYDLYKVEYENRLIIKKKTTYEIIKNKNTDDSSDKNTIIVNNNIENKNVMDELNTKKVNLHIKESIHKIINRNTCGGCGSKVPSNVLFNSLKSLDIFNSLNVYLGVEGCDDCCIFVHSKSKKGENSPALVQTIDFFKSFIDDEYILGEIIAIHCLSDIYSMGGTGICALCVLIVKDNIEKKLQQRLENILTGCSQKLKEEKCVLSGGHTCAGNDNYVGLAVTGKIKKNMNKINDDADYIENRNEKNQRKNSKDHDTNDDINNDEDMYDLNENFNTFKKHKMLKNNYLFLPKGNRNIKSGDIIITTKMFGFGFIMAAHIIKKAKARWIYNCLDEMLISNRNSGLYFLKNNVKACTDVTGYGILGHLNEMIKCSRKEIYLYNKIYNKMNTDSSNDSISNKNGEYQVNNKFKEADKNNMHINFIGAKINLNNIIIAEGVKECIENNIYSSMFKKNHYLCNNIINLDEALLNNKYGILFDPQTSGGLMAIVERECAHQIIQDLKNLGYKNSSIIGEIINVQYEKLKNISLNEISLNDYLDTTNSIYIEC
ncbi:selenide water dikinase, putative [Plasmodium gallinaceum]|uniref:Selenide water dikinase, putative n=1 Tax=Plasmodium gallinaceum TaxID=5849 RepID=A0A1J1H041_PLAGA|nr:selenide water dikinase, putative [Plasmodium gallinaceum]CRG96652.1 selenide water dikinase, putative [Plasmodium gallinaceum]